jgi:hypothetical protein
MLVLMCVRQPVVLPLIGSSSATLSADGQQVAVTLSVVNPNPFAVTDFSAPVSATGALATPFTAASIPANSGVVLAQTFPTTNDGLPSFAITGGQATVAGSTVLLSPATITTTAVGSGACDSPGRDDMPLTRCCPRPTGRPPTP